MKNKTDDIPYCGVRKEVIDRAKPKLDLEELKIHHIYLTERHEIYKKKEIEKRPQSEWTEDEVFQKFKFTNVRRELDRESKWLIKNVTSNENLVLEEKILWCMLFRTWNKSATFEKLGLPNSLDILNFGELDMERMRTIINKEMLGDPKYVWYTSAFNCGGIKATWAMPHIKGMYECTSSNVLVKVEDGDEILEMTWREAKDLKKERPEIVIQGVETNMPMRMLHLINFVRNTDMVQRIITAKDQKTAYEIIKEVDGFSNFLGYQIFVDLTYIDDFKFSENEFTISGPGCSRGIDMLFLDKCGMTHEECLFWLRDNIEKVWKENDLDYYPEELFDHLPEYDRCYNVMMFENSFCEHQKNSKARKGTGRPRNTYKPSGTNHIENEDKNREKNSLF